ncbi:MAG TPA: hypothetical protein VLX92_25655 [Kofleriaceae bacterium]|nr:hypothetical protein [Kofleriaceae bacterium]
MLRALSIALVGLAVAAAANCGGSSSPNHTDGGTKKDGSGKPVDAPPDVGSYDFGCAGSAACTLDKVCCTMPNGSATTFGCEAPASCPTGDQITCDGPSECSGSTPVCCGVDVPDGTGTAPNCGLTSLGTSCSSAANCATHLSNNCTDTTKVQLCHTSTDCTDSTDNKCCTFTSGAASLTFCIDSLTAQLGHGVCH